MFENKIYYYYYYYFTEKKTSSNLYFFCEEYYIVYVYYVRYNVCIAYVNRTKYCHMIFIKKSNNNNNVKYVHECILYHLQKAHI